MISQSDSSLDSLAADGDDRGGTTLKAVHDLGGIFAPRREMSDVELSVDVDILAGLRASYESTLDGTEPPVESVPREGAGSGPSATAADAASVPEEDTPPGTAPDATTAPSPDAPEPLAIDMSRPLVYLTLVAKERRLPGRMVLEALDADGFLPGLMQLYYRRSDSDPTVVVGVANMIESGALDPRALADTETPGLVPFMGVATDPARAVETFDMMVAVSRRLAERLPVTLCDETRSTLTGQAENHMRERIANIAFRSRVEG